MLLTRSEPRDSAAENSDTPSKGSSLFRPGSPDKAAAPARPTTAPVSANPGTSKHLIVGKGISLSGEITACDRLIVEGTVKVVLNQTRAIEITETGIFTEGKAEVEEAEISGRYEGELTVRGRLLIRATGKVSGTVKYGELEVERGGSLAGTLAGRDGSH